MNHEDVIRRLQRICKIYQNTVGDYTAVEAINMAIKTMEKQEVDRWIPMTERLPDVGQRALVQYKNGAMAVVRCNDVGHLTCFYAKMVAWKPAPAPYQEDKV